jgi:hypothetical protein
MLCVCVLSCRALCSVLGVRVTVPYRRHIMQLICSVHSQLFGYSGENASAWFYIPASDRRSGGLGRRWGLFMGLGAESPAYVPSLCACAVCFGLWRGLRVVRGLRVSRYAAREGVPSKSSRCKVLFVRACAGAVQGRLAFGCVRPMLTPNDYSSCARRKHLYYMYHPTAGTT